MMYLAALLTNRIPKKNFFYMLLYCRFELIHLIPIILCIHFNSIAARFFADELSRKLFNDHSCFPGFQLFSQIILFALCERIRHRNTNFHLFHLFHL